MMRGDELSGFASSDPVLRDRLTGLQSAEDFMRRLQRMLSTRSGTGSSVVYLDIADMKSVNSADGTEVGDEVIRRTGRAMAEVFGAGSCARVAGDRFIAVTPAALAAPRVGQVVDMASRTHGTRTMHVHVGIYDVRDGDESGMLACDRAKWAATVDGGVHASTVARFDATMASAMDTELYVRSRIDDVMAGDRIQVWYQPIVRADTLEVAHREALARWFRESGDILPPASFVPTLESSRACVLLDRLVMRTVAADARRLLDAGLRDVAGFSVNVSRVDLLETDVAADLAGALDALSVSHDVVTVEITEGAAEVGIDVLERQIHGLHERGFEVWMDDFGEGLSSLGALQRLDFDLVKLDRSLVRDVAASERARIVAGFAVEMARGIGIPVVAEGVESEEQERFMVGAGCDYLQGYRYGRPAPLTA